MGRESNFCYLDTMCVFCFQTKKGHQIINLGPLTGRQPRKTSRGKSSRNCRDINEPRCAGYEPRTVRGYVHSPRPNTSHPGDSRTPGLGKTFPDLKSKTDAENISNLREKPQSSRVPKATLDPDARVHTRPSSRLPPPLTSSPKPPPLAVSPSLLTPPPAHLHLPPGPRSPDLRVVAPPPRFTPPPTPSFRPHLSAAWTTYGKPARGSVLSATWRLWAWRAERGWGPGGPRGQRPDFSRSPAERRRGHQHF